jgi:hypothetical protein
MLRIFTDVMTTLNGNNVAELNQFTEIVTCHRTPEKMASHGLGSAPIVTLGGYA